MNISNVKKGVYEGLITTNFPSNADRLIVSCLLYDYTKKILENEDKNKNNVKRLVASYAEIYKDQLGVFKEKFVSYIIMVRTIESFRKETFLEFTESEIYQIIDYYKNRTELVKFSITSFSQYMYKIINLKYDQYQRLSNIHFNIMVPIIKFYMDNNGLSAQDLEIFDAEVYKDNPGKEILFGVKGINPTRVVSDIKTNNILIDYYKVETYDSYVKIINK
jgi:hypothetical protein